MCTSLIITTNLANGGSKEVNDAFVRHGNHAVTIDFNDTMTHTHAAPFTNTTTQQAAYLSSNSNSKEELLLILFQLTIRTRWHTVECIL